MADITERLRQAAEIIADQARRNAGGWSARIPPSVKVSVSGRTAVISSDAPPAYPNEVAGVRHPVFGGPGTRRPRAPWVTNQHRPFLGPAADAKASDAMERWARKYDRLLAKAGFHKE